MPIEERGQIRSRPGRERFGSDRRAVSRNRVVGTPEFLEHVAQHQVRAGAVVVESQAGDVFVERRLAFLPLGRPQLVIGNPGHAARRLGSNQPRRIVEQRHDVSLQTVQVL